MLYCVPPPSSCTHPSTTLAISQTLQVSVTAGETSTAELRPDTSLPSLVFWPLFGPGIGLICVAALLLLPFAPRSGSVRAGRRLLSRLSPRRCVAHMRGERLPH